MVVEVPLAGDDVIVVLELELLVPPAGEGFTMVVLLSVLVPGDAAVVVVGWTSVRCSQPASSAALARMQIVFFIVVGWMICP